MTIPKDVSSLKPHELNRYVRQLIDRVTVSRGTTQRLSTNPARRKKGVMIDMASYALTVHMKNGLMVPIGNMSVGFQKR